MGVLGWVTTKLGLGTRAPETSSSDAAAVESKQAKGEEEARSIAEVGRANDGGGVGREGQLRETSGADGSFDAAAAAVDAEPAVSATGKILFGSQTGTARRLAHKLAASLRTRHGVSLDVADLSSYDPEDLVSESVALVILSTYEGAEGAVPPEAAQYFCRWANESSQDERFGMLYLKDVTYAVFGCGNREYGPDRFNAAARGLDAALARLGGNRLLRRADGDESSGRMEEQFHEWADKLGERLNPDGARQQGKKAKGSRVVVGGKTVAVRGAGKWIGGEDGKSAAEVGKAAVAEIEAHGGVVQEVEAVDYDTDAEEGSSDGDNSDDEGGEGEMSAGSEDDMDMEDIGADGKPKEKREMVTDQLRAALTKQGYKILGSHSGVKLCRWTKAMLRGRGGCYKHTFYGIESHRCMEATPSLACANKCVFCWRHHTNPVGREWRWQMDDPLELVESAVSEHKGMIKQMKGIPGLIPARFDEGMDPRHCALSLVGEPIMYPEIGKFVNALHERRISTFLVTNAQFPDAIKNLPAITQLYVSVDAATPETLKAIDRPLFGDYWVGLVARNVLRTVFFSVGLQTGTSLSNSDRSRNEWMTAARCQHLPVYMLLRGGVNLSHGILRTYISTIARTRSPHANTHVRIMSLLFLTAHFSLDVFFAVVLTSAAKFYGVTLLPGQVRGQLERTAGQEPAHGVPPHTGCRLECGRC